MGDHEHRQAQGFRQVADQVVEAAGADRIQARGRLVEEQELRVHGQGAGQPRPLDHAAGKLRWLQVPHAGGQADQGQLQFGQLVHGLVGQPGMLVHRRGDVLAHGQVGEQRPRLEQHAPALLEHLKPHVGDLVHVLAEDADLAGLRLPEPDQGPQQHRLAGAGAADQAHDLAPPDGEVQAVVDHVIAEVRDQAANLDRRRPLVRLGAAQTCSSV